MCHTGQCVYEDTYRGECTLPQDERIPNDAGCKMAEEEFKRDIKEKLDVSFKGVCV